MTPGEKRVLELAAKRGGCPKTYFDNFRGLKLIAKGLIWEGYVGLLGTQLCITQKGQERLESAP